MKDWSSKLPISKADLYWSEAEVIRVIDGDTIETNGILPFHHGHYNLDLRLKDLFCFETRKPRNNMLDALMSKHSLIGVGDRLELIEYMKFMGQHSKTAMENLVQGERLLIKTYKTTFDRYVAEVWRQRDGLNIIEWMLENKFGQREDPTEQSFPYGELFKHWKEKTNYKKELY